MGCQVDASLKSRLNQEKSVLLEDENLAKMELENQELVQKARVHEASQSVPKRAVQGLAGYDNWLSWSTEIRELLESVMTEASKAAIIYESLKVAEDREFLKGINSSTEILNYLSGKYNRPSEVCEAQLAQIKRLSPAKSDKDMMTNILKFQSVHRDLNRYAAASKVDTYFVNSVRHIILTEVELKRYLREHEQHQLRHLRKSRGIKRSSTVGAAGDLTGGSGSDSDGDSDDSLCSKFSFADKGAFSGDKSSTRDRKFFLRFLKELLVTLRHLESAQHHTGKGVKKTASYKTDNLEGSDRTCIVKGCSTKHLNKRGQAVNTLALCGIFKGLSFKDKIEYMKVGRCCYTCTTPGHQSKACKSNLTCQAKGTDGKVCCSKTHHTLLHKEAAAGGAKQAAKTGQTENFQTES